MSNIEHLIENALRAMESANARTEDTRLAFEKEMAASVNKQMLQAVRMTKDELWQIAQYIIYSYCQNCDCVR